MKKVAGPIFLLAIANGIFAVSGYCIHIFLGRYLGPSEYGAYGLIITLMNIVNLLLTSGLPASLSKYTAEFPKESVVFFSKALRMQVILAITIAMAYALSSPIISRFFQDHSLQKLIAISALVFPTYSIYALYFSYFNGLHRFRLQAVLLSAYAISKALFSIILSIAFKISGAIFAFILAPLVALITVWLVGHKLSSGKAAIPITRRQHSILLLKFALPITLFAVFSTATISVDLIVIKLVLQSNFLAGLYTAATTLAMSPSGVLSAISIVFFPIIINTRRLNNGRFPIETVRLALLSGALVVIFFGILMVTLGKYAITTLYSVNYVGAVPAFTILAFAFCFYTLFSLTATLLSALGKPEIPAKICVFALPITIVLNVFLVPKYALQGAALSTTISTIFMFGLALFSLRRLALEG